MRCPRTRASQILQNVWLIMKDAMLLSCGTGGASNTGGAVLRHYFQDARLRELTERINVLRSPGLGYYPLLEPGERCPVRIKSPSHPCNISRNS